MKYIRMILCAAAVCFLLFTPQALVKGAQEQFVDTRFVRKTDGYRGSVVICHIVRHRPYAGSITQWLKSRAEAYEKKHKGTFIEIEGMDETHFYERLDRGRRPDAYSFFSGTLYPDRLAALTALDFPYREGVFRTERCIPYCFSGYCRLIRKPDGGHKTAYFADPVLAARCETDYVPASEEKADDLYLDLRRAGDLIRYKDGFALAEIEPVDSFTDAVCWMGIDRETDDEKANVILDFIAFLLEPESQQTLNPLGLLSVRADVKNVPPEAGLKQVFRAYESVSTVDPFLWNAQYDALTEDAALAAGGDAEAKERFRIRLNECRR